MPTGCATGATPTRRDVLDRIVADLKAQAPDHIAVTGDLVNIGLPQEHINALAWLESLGPPERVTVIPGNHDIYSRLRGDPGTRALGRLHGVRCAQGARACRRQREFPVRAHAGAGGDRSASTRRCRRRRSWPRAVSGPSSSPGSAPCSSGSGEAGIFRLVLIHHPPLPGQARRFAACEDAAELQAVLSRHGAELVIHGHNHRNMLAWCTTAAGARAGGRRAVGVAWRASQGRAAGPLQPLPHRRAALVGRACRSRPRGGGGTVVELERRTLAAGGPWHEKRSWEP